MSHNKKLELDFEKIQSETSLEFNKYGDIVISSVRGDKDIYYERFGVKKTIIGAFDVNTFPWMYLTPGLNQFMFDLEDEYLDDVVISVEHRGAYGGI